MSPLISSLFDSLEGKDIPELPLTFKEAMRLGEEELHKKRRFRYDLETWNDIELSFNSENINNLNKTPHFDSMVDAENERNPKVSVANLTLSPLVIFKLCRNNFRILMIRIFRIDFPLLSRRVIVVLRHFSSLWTHLLTKVFNLTFINFSSSE